MEYFLEVWSRWKYLCGWIKKKEILPKRGKSEIPVDLQLFTTHDTEEEKIRVKKYTKYNGHGWLDAWRIEMAFHFGIAEMRIAWYIDEPEKPSAIDSTR